jgi:small-conductance mechanosensitive channel
MIEKITIISVSVIFISIALMSIESLRSIGVSILTSAGVIGVVVGLAAQRSEDKYFREFRLHLHNPSDWTM